MVVTPLDFSTPVTYSAPSPWVPSDVVENLNGWFEEWLNIYLCPASKFNDFFS